MRVGGIVVIAAAGPSFSQAQADHIAAARAAGVCTVVVVNESWRRIPSADMLYAADGAWYFSTANTPVASGALRTPGLITIEALRRHFPGARWTQDRGQIRPPGGDREQWPDVARRHGINIIRSADGAGLHAEPGVIYKGGNSGHQAIALAVKLFAPSRIVLVGFDMQRANDGDGAHWHGRHELPLSNGNPASWIPHFETMARDLVAAGIECWNASGETALKCFRRSDLSDALTSDALPPRSVAMDARP